MPRMRADPRRYADVAQRCRNREETADIVRAVVAKFGVAARTVHRDVENFYAELAEGSERSRPRRRSLMRNNLEADYRDARARGDFTNAGKNLDRLAKLDGLYAAERVQIEHRGAIGVNPKRLTSAEARAKVAEYATRIAQRVAQAKASDKAAGEARGALRAVAPADATDAPGDMAPERAPPGDGDDVAEGEPYDDSADGSA